MFLFEKIEIIVKCIYCVDEVLVDVKICNQLCEWEEVGYGNLLVCMVKIQYSFLIDLNLCGVLVGYFVLVCEVCFFVGVGFIVVVCGEIMIMSGLLCKLVVEMICFNVDGEIEGLF